MPKKSKEKQSLTPRQQEIHDFVLERIRSAGRPPTTQQMATEFGISIGNVSRFVSEICAKGWLTQDRGKRYSLRPVEETAS